MEVTATAAPAAASHREGPQLASSPSIEAIVARAREGDDVAFAEVYRVCSGAITHYVGAIVGDPDRTEDAVAETFLHAWRDLPRLRKIERFDAWLLRIAHNRAINEVRRRRAAAIEDVAEPEDPSPRSAPAGVAEQRWESDRLRQHLLQLSDAHREVLVLRFLHELSHAESSPWPGPQVVEELRAWRHTRHHQVIARPRARDVQELSPGPRFSWTPDWGSLPLQRRCP